MKLKNELPRQLLLNFDKDEKTVAIKQKSPLDISLLLVSYTGLSNLKLFIKPDLFYLYDETEGIYKQLVQAEIEMEIRHLLSIAEYPPLFSAVKLKQIFQNLKYDSRVSLSGDIRFDKHILVFSNGALNIETLEMTSWSPRYFVTSKLPFPYNPTANCPAFLEFATEFSEGKSDRLSFLRAYLNAIVFSKTEYQIFLYLLGRGATGKSTFGHIATALVGENATVATTLKSLNNDLFEVSNLIGKKLILINDTEYYKGDISILKQLSGGDSLRGRIKFVQGNFDVKPEGLLLIIGNQPLGIKDASDAIYRRMRTFTVSKVFHSRDIVIRYENQHWVGKLGQELSGIFNWVISMEPEEVSKYLINTYDMVPSLQDSFNEAQENLHPLLSWIKDELIPGKGSYLGYKSEFGLRAQIETAKRKALYPIYESWSHRQGSKPLAHKAFSKMLVETLRSQGWSIEKVRMSEGYFLKGVVPNPIVFIKDYQMGATITEENELSESTEQAKCTKSTPSLTQIPSNLANSSEVSELSEPSVLVNQPIDVNNFHSLETTSELSELTEQAKYTNLTSDSTEIPSNLANSSEVSELSEPSVLVNLTIDVNNLKELEHRLKSTHFDGDIPNLESVLNTDLNTRSSRNQRLSRNLYLNYSILLAHRSPEKRFLNESFQKHVQSNPKWIEDIGSSFLAKTSFSSENYETKVRSILKKGVAKLIKFGAIPFSYKSMGISPRILPISYGNTINNVKSILRVEAYQVMGNSVFSTHRKVLVDFDLRSCYTSILMGLFKARLPSLSFAMNGPGIWEFIRKEFEAQGRGDSYDKAAVKVCVYSSFFGGGQRAMINSILDSKRKDLGLLPQEFRESESYESFYNHAQSIANQMSNSSILLDFRDLSHQISKEFRQEGLLGPTGHLYKFNQSNFYNAYPNFLQSYEFGILAQATLETISAFPQVELLGHFHDGNVLLIPEAIQPEVISFFEQKVTSIGYDLGLAFPQTIEIKRTFPSST